MSVASGSPPEHDAKQQQSTAATPAHKFELKSFLFKALFLLTITISTLGWAYFLIVVGWKLIDRIIFS